MNFNILYVEDNEEHAADIENAAKHSRKNEITSRPLHVDWVRSPDDIASALEARPYDLVLADVYFGEPKKDRLKDVIDAVIAWGKQHSPDRPIPIIAYTSEGQAALDDCLARKESLYDIWDKHTARPPYVAWRFNKLALELARNRPDALLQRRIRQMATAIEIGPRLNASWHEEVVQMTFRYDSGGTELDQITRAGTAIHNIAMALGTFGPCDKCWQIMVKWEALGRAVSRRTRGHSRHVINVFWLGYYLLHHPNLREFFTNAWTELIKKRSDMEAVADELPLEALSNAWFYAALFHDIGGCVEKQTQVIKSTNELLNYYIGILQGDPLKFYDVARKKASDAPLFSGDFDGKADALFFALSEPLRKIVKPLWEKGVGEKHPDHGVIAAVYLTDSLKTDAKQLPYAREAGRAMMLHNLVGAFDDGPAKGLSWTSEPLACLLILCDQLQTWDRERDDKILTDKDEPERAELSKLDVTMADSRPLISIVVDYLAPRHLDHAADIFRSVADTLDYILKDKPYRALAHIEKPWPIGLKVECWLNNQKLGAKMDF